MKLSDPIYWSMTSLIREASQTAMDKRADREVSDVVQGKTLDDAHSEAIRDYPVFEQFILQVALEFSHRLGLGWGSKAVDLGSGTGVGACILSKLPFMHHVYAVEYSEHFVQKIMPLVFERFGAQTEKIQRVVGDFNHQELEDRSLDLILEIEAFHHSENLEFTVQECERVLKPGGVMLVIDRAWPDHYTSEQLEAMLDKEFSAQLKTKYGIPAESSFTRRDFGEHEYTVQQCIIAFRRKGFAVTVFQHWHPPFLNRWWLKLPILKATVFLDAILYKLGFRRLRVYGFSNTRVLFLCIKQ